jgi:hypothetical protein
MAEKKIEEDVEEEDAMSYFEKLTSDDEWVKVKMVCGKSQRNLALFFYNNAAL